MLELINLTETDTLYIIGDVIDRYPYGIEIIEKIMASKNMIMILGNHEYMCLKTLGWHNEIGAKQLWKMNGGTCTYNTLAFNREFKETRKILDFLESLPDHLDIEVNNTKFHLVHGWFGADTYSRVWTRPDTVNLNNLPNDRLTIIGHTPTPLITDDYTGSFKIYHGDRFIDIDCGCGNETPLRQLACLRLDDMAEFYV
jgi:serine/threonine protein phosphatase 1